MSGMQFGIFTVGDVTADPTTGRKPTEAERIRATVQIALKAEEVGLDVFATGEHHNPPFVPASPTTLLGYHRLQIARFAAAGGDPDPQCGPVRNGSRLAGRLTTRLDDRGAALAPLPADSHSPEFHCSNRLRTTRTERTDAACQRS